MMTEEEAIKQLDGAKLMLLNRKYELFQQAYIMAINALHSQQEHFRDNTKKIKTLTNRQQLTNADRIRAMSDEDMAKFLAEVNGDKVGGMSKFWMQWLQQPVSEVSEYE